MGDISSLNFSQAAPCPGWLVIDIYKTLTSVHKARAQNEEGKEGGGAA